MLLAHRRGSPGAERGKRKLPLKGCLFSLELEKSCMTDAEHFML